jgi:hypothetical protein
LETHKNINTMKLNIKERLMMLELLPEKGALLTMTNKRNIIKKVDFSSEEIETFEIKQNEKGITWKNEEKSKDVDFNSEELKLLKDSVDELDKNNSITDAIFDLCVKIKEA